MWSPDIPPPLPGRIQLAYANWEQITSDQWVLDTVKGYQIPLLKEPIHAPSLQPYCLSAVEEEALQQELARMSKLGAIEMASMDGFLSNHFVVPKSGGRWRAVFNLRRLNEFVPCLHFKMESLGQLPLILEKGDWLAKIDLKDAFHSIPIHPSSRHLLQFVWQHQRWQYTCLPFGLAVSPRTFTKVLRPVATALREAGVKVIMYLDDWLITGHSQEEVQRGVSLATHLLSRLGFEINIAKSVLIPVQSLTFLGADISTTDMSLSLPPVKLEKIRHECRRIRNNGAVTMPELRSLIGQMVQARVAVHLDITTSVITTFR